MSKPMVVCPFLLLGMILTLPAEKADGQQPSTSSVEVGVERLEVFNEPDDEGFVTAFLARGDTVVVHKALAGGWLAIAPPIGSFHWVEDNSTELLRDGRIYVTAPSTILRLGREGFPRPGPLKTTLIEGAVLRAARQPMLSYTEGRRRKVWRAVLASSDEVRFIRSSGVLDSNNVNPSPVMPVVAAERRTSHTVAEAAELPADLVVPLREVESNHRSVIARPIEEWNFATVRNRYQALLAGHTDGTSRHVIQERLDEVDRGDELAKSAREFEDLVRKSRRRDGVINQIKKKVRDLRDAEELTYDAEGLLQATSRQVDGEKVFSLLNDQGQVVAYLKIPPGIDTANLITKQVGVRGKSRFNGTLRYRLLVVSDMERLTSDD